jgi:hypothetical protein
VRALEMAPRVSGRVAHAMAVRVDVAVATGGVLLPIVVLFVRQISHPIVVRFSGGFVVVAAEDLASRLSDKSGRLVAAGHHAFEARSVLGAVKARRFAPAA